MIDALLEGIEVRLDTDYFIHREEWNNKAGKILFTGCIDEFFDYQCGHLEYRSLRFEHQHLPMEDFQGNAVVNYTEREVPYTRIIEHKHFEHFGDAVYSLPKTVVTHEFSTEWTPGSEPFYPVNDEKNNALYARYKELADAESRVIFGGRLAEYKYYDMAPIIERLLALFNVREP